MGIVIKSHPARGTRLFYRALAGAAGFAFFFWLGCVQKIEPFYTYFYLFAWLPFLWTLDSIYAYRTGKAFVKSPAELLWLAAFSTTLWCVFEAFNFRLTNWVYIGLPHEWWLRWPGYALSFATVAPGILWGARLAETFARRPARPSREDLKLARPRRVGKALRERRVRSTGFLMMILPLLWPRLFFPLIWGCLFFILDPQVRDWGGHSLFQDWQTDRWGKTVSLLISGLFCGFFWEFCNYWAGSKWVYRLPFWEFGKVFEMPILGYLGFPTFALAVYIMHEAAAKIWENLSRQERRMWSFTAAVFCATVFAGIDAFTVAGWK